MKYKLPIVTCLISACFGVIWLLFGYQSGSIFPILNAQPPAVASNISSSNTGIPVDEAGNPMDLGSDQEPQGDAEGNEFLSDPKVILKRAIAQMHSETRFQAAVRHRIDMFDQNLVGAGHYRQFGNGSIKRLRFELKIQVGENTASVVQVCDGRHLWTRENLADSTSLSRIDVRYISDALQKQEQKDAQHSTGVLAANWGANIAMGGIPRLLASLQSSFHFTSTSEATYEDVPVWVLVGKWKPEVREQIAAKFGSAKKFPTHLPDAVRIVLGRDVEFKFIPREIQYLKVASDKTVTPMVSLQLYDITRLVDMNASQFEYQRGEQVIVDRTQAFLDKYIPTP